jgi:tRNA threonylcarbamoyladenosine biosynthesis protein TsaE
LHQPEPVIQRESLDEPGLARLAVELARVFAPGDVVVLSGEVGVGKTTLVRAAARELGVADDVTSPTYQLARAYRGVLDGRPLAVEHLDLYRLEGLDPYDALDLDEHLRPDAIAFVEWADPAIGLLGDPTVIRISHESATTRRVSVSGPAARRLAEREAEC